jgi:hypothetical protein
MLTGTINRHPIDSSQPHTTASTTFVDSLATDESGALCFALVGQESPEPSLGTDPILGGSALASDTGPMPTTHVNSIGIGAGSLDVTSRANVVRVAPGYQPSTTQGLTCSDYAMQ